MKNKENRSLCNRSRVLRSVQVQQQQQSQQKNRGPQRRRAQSSTSFRGGSIKASSARRVKQIFRGFKESQGYREYKDPEINRSLDISTTLSLKKYLRQESGGQKRSVKLLKQLNITGNKLSRSREQKAASHRPKSMKAQNPQTILHYGGDNIPYSMSQSVHRGRITPLNMGINNLRIRSNNRSVEQSPKVYFYQC